MNQLSLVTPTITSRSNWRPCPQAKTDFSMNQRALEEVRKHWWSLGKREAVKMVKPITGWTSTGIALQNVLFYFRRDFSKSWGWSKPLILGWNDVHSVVETCLQCVESAGCREGQRGVQRNSDQTAEVLWKSLCCLPYTSCNDPHLARASRSSKADSVPKLSYFRWQPLFRNWSGWSFCSLINKWFSGVGFDWALPSILVRYPRYTSADGEIDMAPLGNRGDQPDGVRDLID